MKKIRITSKGAPSDYRHSLVPLIIANLGYQIDWVDSGSADLEIIGPFVSRQAKKMRWVPKPLRKMLLPITDAASVRIASRQYSPLRLFQTGENLRHDHVIADYAISHDLGVMSDRHFRFPYWMEMVDWSHEGLHGNCNPRFGALLKFEQLEKPLGGQFLERERRAILLSSHLREPRASCMQALQRSVAVDGFGPHFDKNIKDHHHSSFLKKDLLSTYAFNLCPENGLYPGYVTEKIPEAFAAGCLPITWVDESISVDFNPAAMINVKPMMQDDFSGLADILSSEKRLAGFMGQRLLLRRPSIEPFRQFIARVLLDATR
jgi:hypothetical protein